MEAREDELRRAFFGEIQKALLEHDTSQGERLVQIERQLERQNSEFMMVQQMNDANNMQHEEARRQAMKAVKVKLDEIQRKTRGQMLVLALKKPFFSYETKILIPKRFFLLAP